MVPAAKPSVTVRTGDLFKHSSWEVTEIILVCFTGWPLVALLVAQWGDPSLWPFEHLSDPAASCTSRGWMIVFPLGGAAEGSRGAQRLQPLHLRQRKMDGHATGRQTPSWWTLISPPHPLSWPWPSDPQPSWLKAGGRQSKGGRTERRNSRKNEANGEDERADGSR